MNPFSDLPLLGGSLEIIPTRTAPYQIGRTSGPHFTPWRLESCELVARELAELGATDLRVWYDNYCDFHHCDGYFNGHFFTVRYYKVFCLYCNGYQSTGLIGDHTWIPYRLHKYATGAPGKDHDYATPAIWNVE